MDFNNTKSKTRQRKGQEMVEWWFIITAVSFVVMWSLFTWGGNLNQIMTKLNDTLNSVNSNVSTSG